MNQELETGQSNLIEALQIFRALFTQEPDVRRDIAHSKRFLERLSGDDVFRSDVLSGELSLPEAQDACGCKIDVSTLRPVFDPAFCKHRPGATLEDWRLTYLWDRHMHAAIAARNALLLKGGSGGYNKQFDGWRARNINRSVLQLGIASVAITHPAVCFELSSGCSVGCWFCGISAEKFKGHATLADGGAEQWRQTLEAVKAVIGPASQTGFCYWATDPLDNPEYIGFLDIYEDVVGTTPQTTTAIPLRNVELTRAVLERWEARRTTPNRFSIMTKRRLLEVHETFTADELYGVELVIQIRSQGGTSKAMAGRAFTDAKTKERAKAERGVDGTIACVSGFLINIVEKTIKLITPTMPSAEYPNGYMTLMEESYTDAGEVEAILRRAVDTQMKENLLGDRPISITRGGLYEETSGRPEVRFKEFCVENDSLTCLGGMLRSSSLTPVSVVKSAMKEGMHPIRAMAALDSLWKEGVLCQDAA